VIVPLLLGAGFGLGLWALIVCAVPPRPGLAALLAGLEERTAQPPPITTPSPAGWASRLGRPFVPLLASAGLPSPRLRKDLAITGRSPAQHLADKATLTLAGLILPLLVQAGLTLVGFALPWTLPLVACLVVGAGGFLLPDLAVHQEAARRRADFRLALSAYLNLVRITLAGGAGVDGALTDAASVGSGWAFTQLRRAVSTARLTRSTPWTTLRQLGEELDVRELMELSASVSLAGTEGAKVRASLAAKASALRTHELADAEGQAQAATERMSLPVIVLFTGFLIFIGYPALAQVLGGL
jgi:tight adherence protein C